MNINLTTKEILIDLIKTKPIFSPIYKLIVRRNVNKWEKKGRPAPPPHQIKRNTVKKYANDQGINSFIETGTFLGHMLYSVKNMFKHVYSIELSPELTQRARKKFASDKNIKIIEGDSAVQLPILMNEINERCIFWLDGHYSDGVTAEGDEITPVNSEIETIAAHKIKDHVILIDDARLFNGVTGYPVLAEFKKYAVQKFPNHHFSIENDIIVINPK